MPFPSHRPSQISYRRQRSSRGTKAMQPDRKRSVWLLLVLLLLWSLCLGIGLAQATEPQSRETTREAIAQIPPTNSTQPVATPTSTSSRIGTVDVVPERYQAAQNLYLQHCSTCHIALPPAVMPSETWRTLIQDTQHYGAELKPLDRFEIQGMWQYLRDFSRPQAIDEQTPYRLYESRIFRALHPRVKFAQRVNLESCISCHPGAGQYDFRSLSAEWQNAP
ncbi:diheme cytochrome c [Leptodesmis sichuanensis]|uniref:diheme cytochrome c n=1 Tax=Leptodesmis sichuanensis TaxID=2906798 RepID=UPI001F324885|nr:diheme cytochrome c [Leptodesmis sichuanensis]